MKKLFDCIHITNHMLATSTKMSLYMFSLGN